MLSLQRLASGARPLGVRAFSTAPTFDWQTDNSNVAIRGKVSKDSPFDIIIEVLYPKYTHY